MKKLFSVLLIFALTIYSGILAHGGNQAEICGNSHGGYSTGYHIHDKYDNLIPCNKNTGIPFQISVVVNGELVKFDQPPIILNSRTMVPIAKVVEMMNCQVNWDNDTRTVYINDEFYHLEKNAVPTNDINVYVNNKKVNFSDQKPTILNGRTYVPVKMVAEQLDCLVSWDAKLQTVYIEQISYY